jgi:hypothetical protein
MNLSKKSVALLLTGAAMASISTHASAVSSTQLGALTANGVITQSGQMAVKNWADITVGLGWMHTTKWIEFSVDANAASAGNVIINLTDTSKRYTSASTANNGNTTIMKSNGNTSHPAFSLFSVGAAGFDEAVATAFVNYPNTGVGWTQVDVSPTKQGAFLLVGGVTGFEGYANSGTTFANSAGDNVGHGSSGSSYGTTAGHDWAELNISLAAGNYLLAIGNSCFTLANCGNEVTQRVVLDSNFNIITNETNPSGRWNNADYKLSITSVPVPGAVWLFGSALAGLVGLRRRPAA